MVQLLTLFILCQLHLPNRHQLQACPGSSVSMRTTRRRGQVLRQWAATTHSMHITMVRHTFKTSTTTTTAKTWSGKFKWHASIRIVIPERKCGTTWQLNCCY
jgi:hypothetical protein